MDFDPVEALSAHDRWPLLSAATGRSPAWLMARDLRRSSLIESQLGAPAAALARRMARDRLSQRPLAQVVGETGFYGRTFWITPDVLIPRPDSECLIEASLVWLDAFQATRKRQLRLLDLGTGSGCLAITLALEANARGWAAATVATDLSPRALRLARTNALWLGAAVEFFQGDWGEALPKGLGRFDLIVSNPPYLAESDPHLTDPGLQHEPRLALVGESQNEAGLAAYPRLLAMAKDWLEPNGLLMVEHGWTQQPALVSLFERAGFSGVQRIQDLAGRPRAVCAHL